MKKLREWTKVGNKVIIAVVFLGIGMVGHNAKASAASVSYSIHGQTYGDQGVKKDGQAAGTTGKAKRLEAVKLNVSGDGGIKYQIHGQTYGWQKWVSNGQQAGSKGIAKRAEAIKIELTGNLAKTHDVLYRVHGQTYGWQGWKKNGEIAGTTGLYKRLEAVEVKLVAKQTTTNIPVSAVNASISATSLKVGGTAKVTASVAPQNATNKALTYSSSNSSVVTIDSNGNIKAVGAGSTTITVQSNNGLKKTFNMTVTKNIQTPVINVKNMNIAWGSDFNTSMLRSGYVSGTDENGQTLTFERLTINERQAMNTKKSGNYIYDVSYGGVTRQIFVTVNPPVYNKQAVRAEMLLLVNELRASVGVQPVYYDTVLNAASDIRANELVELYSHQRPNGQDGRTTISDIDSNYLLNHWAVLENIANNTGEKTNEELAKDFFLQWKNSPGHYRTMVHSDVTNFGFSYSESEGHLCYAVQLVSANLD